MLEDTWIPLIEAAEIYDKFLRGEDLVMKNDKDHLDYHFRDLIPCNLDFLHLESVEKFRRKKTEEGYFSFDFVDVSFQYPLCRNKSGKRVFQAKGAYEKHSRDEMRESLYLKGFVLNGKKYVRYKRSSGSAKKGNCLFIREDLSPMMEKWSLAGLDRKKCREDLTSFEAYKALSLSSLVLTLDLDPDNILFVPDFRKEVENQEVIEVSCKDGSLAANRVVRNVENNIFDGEGLLDESVFREAGKAKKGMMLLRSRYFKCCAFNTDLQKWFRDNDIKDVRQLRGFTSAQRIEDIVLVASESCLKYVKLASGGFSEENVRKWCDQIREEKWKFGVVKTDKVSRFFRGSMTETTYQFLNSLELGNEEMTKLIKDNLDYVRKIRDLKNTPEFIRFYLEGEETGGRFQEDIEGEDTLAEEDVSDEEISDALSNYTSFTFKNKVCLDLIRIDGRAKNTALFRRRVFDSIMKSLRMKFYKGRILVHGTYMTLFGNPYEYLQYIIGKDIKEPLLGKNEISTSFFDNGTELAGTRAPHTTMGNVLYCRNRHLPEIDRYFNLSPEIVVVDAMNNNIQQRLSGCDYDSDTVLLTDNPVLVSAARKNYDAFPVPFAGFSPEKRKLSRLTDDIRENDLQNLIRIDNRIASHRVGEIINLAQRLNSHLWNEKKRNDETLRNLYDDIAVLAVLSGAEIDSAKRDFPFDIGNVLKGIERKYGGKSPYGKKPMFFKAIETDRNGKRLDAEKIRNATRVLHREFDTAMDVLWEIVNQEDFTDGGREGNITLFTLFGKDYRTEGNPTDWYKQCETSFEKLETISESIYSFRKRGIQDFHAEKADFDNQMAEAFRKLKTGINSPQKAKMLLKSLEEKKKDGFTELFVLLYVIECFSGKLGYSLKDLLPEDAVPLPSLAWVEKEEKEDYVLFGNYRFKKHCFSLENNEKSDF